MGSYLATLSSGFISPADDPPPAPALDALRRAGLPTVAPPMFQASLDGLADRRRLLRGLLDAEGWRWEEITEPAAGAR